SGPHRAASPVRAEPAAPRVTAYRQYNAPAEERHDDDRSMPERSVGTTLLDLVVDRLAAAAEPVHQIWLPPMPGRFTLDQVAGPVETAPDGLCLALRTGQLRVPVGLVDDPGRQRQGVWTLDLTTAGGHLAVI